MSRVSVPLSWNDFGSFIAEANALVNVRKGCVVIAGTALNQVKPLAYNASADSTAVIGIAQEDADAGQPVRVALPGQIGIARVTSTPSLNNFLAAGAGSATDAENGMLDVETVSSGDLIVARALEDGTAKSFIKVAVMCVLFP